MDKPMYHYSFDTVYYLPDKICLSYGGLATDGVQVYIREEETVLSNSDHMCLAVAPFPSGCATVFSECKLIWAVSAS